MCYSLCMGKYFDRFEQMIGQEKLDFLMKKKIILFGVGGVGGYVAEMLVRSGISELSVVDFDKVDITNINRQIIALNSTLKELKVDVMEKRLKDINPSAKIKKITNKLSSENIREFELEKYDYVIDCIDDLKAKKALIKYCYENGLNIIVSCGAGNRFSYPLNFEVSDIKKTSYDPIAKILRKYCASEGIKKLMVVYTKTEPIKSSLNTVASVAYYPASMACTIVAYVINELLKK